MVNYELLTWKHKIVYITDIWHLRCARFVNLRNLQNTLRNFEILHQQFRNFWDPTLSKHLELAEHPENFQHFQKLSRGKTPTVYIDLGPQILTGG